MRASHTLWTNGEKDRPTFLEDLARVKAARERMLSAQAPDDGLVLELLNSPRQEEFAAAATAAAVYKIYPPSIMDRLIMLLGQELPIERKAQVISALRNADQAVIARYHDEIIAAITKEQDEKALERELALLRQLPPEEAFPVLLELLSRPSKRLKFRVYIRLRTMGSEYAERAKRELVNRNDFETSALIQNWEENPDSIPKW